MKEEKINWDAIRVEIKEMIPSLREDLFKALTHAYTHCISCSEIQKAEFQVPTCHEILKIKYRPQQLPISGEVTDIFSSILSSKLPKETRSACQKYFGAHARYGCETGMGIIKTLYEIAQPYA